jgi:hypothetical protein
MMAKFYSKHGWTLRRAPLVVAVAGLILLPVICSALHAQEPGPPPLRANRPAPALGLGAKPFSPGPPAGPGMARTRGFEMRFRHGPGIPLGRGPGMRPGPGRGMGPERRLGTPPRPGMGRGFGPGMGPGRGTGPGRRLGTPPRPGMGRGFGPGMRPGRGRGVGPGRRFGTPPRLSMGRGFGPGMQPARGLAVGRGSGPEPGRLRSAPRARPTFGPPHHPAGRPSQAPKRGESLPPW